jgi:uncharacterized protein YijF (DUF1287 family)
VTWLLPGKLPDIGIVVSPQAGAGMRPIIAHNVGAVGAVGAGPRREDVLFDYPITGRYRYSGGYPGLASKTDPSDPTCGSDVRNEQGR